jgi:hypothetical protein
MAVTVPSTRYRAVAREFLALAESQGRPVLPQPATSADVAKAEQALGCRFPLSYQWFQCEFGDFLNGPLDIYSVKPIESPGRNIVSINLEERTAGDPPLPSSLIAFSDSGGGDFLCFDTSAISGSNPAGFLAGECPVVWWDLEGDISQTPERAGNTFLDWHEAELWERAAAAPGSRFDALGHVYRTWLRQWFGRQAK